jgi:hypothetical protein
MYTEDENPSKPPTEVHQLAPQDIEQRIVDISLESEKALPLPNRGCIEGSGGAFSLSNDISTIRCSMPCGAS